MYIANVKMLNGFDVRTSMCSSLCLLYTFIRDGGVHTVICDMNKYMRIYITDWERERAEFYFDVFNWYILCDVSHDGNRENENSHQLGPGYGAIE